MLLTQTAKASRLSIKVDKFYQKDDNDFDEKSSQYEMSDHSCSSKSKLSHKSIGKSGNISKIMAKIAQIDSSKYIDIELNVETEIESIKLLLLKQLKLTITLNKSLKSRCGDLDNIISMFDTKVEFDTGLQIKTSDLAHLKYHLNKLSTNLLSFTKKEVNLNMQRRENELISKKLQLLKNQYNQVISKLEETRQGLDISQSAVILRSFSRKTSIVKRKSGVSSSGLKIIQPKRTIQE